MNAEDPSEKLATGLLEIYEPGLRKLQKQLAELTTKQEVLLRETALENKNYHDIQLSETSSLFAMVKEYHVRLMNVKSEMSNLSDRSAKLKRRALRVQELKQREALESAHLRESQMLREENLIGKSTDALPPP